MFPVCLRSFLLLLSKTPLSLPELSGHVVLLKQEDCALDKLPSIEFKIQGFDDRTDPVTGFVVFGPGTFGELSWRFASLDKDAVAESDSCRLH